MPADVLAPAFLIQSEMNSVLWCIINYVSLEVTGCIINVIYDRYIDNSFKIAFYCVSLHLVQIMFSYMVFIHLKMLLNINKLICKSLFWQMVCIDNISKRLVYKTTVLVQQVAFYLWLVLSIQNIPFINRVQFIAHCENMSIS